jgi:hypothetical protein
MLRTSLIAASSLLLALPALAETKSYDFKTFTRLDISAGYEVIFTQSPTRSVTIESENFDKIRISQNGDTLNISRPPNTSVRSRNTDVVRISAPDLESADLSAGVKFTSASLTIDNLDLDVSAGVEATFGNLKAKNVRVDASAGVVVELKGECESIKVDASAGAELKAKDFRCREARAEGSAGASLYLNASELLRADAGVGASIQVAGKPKSVDKSASLGGSVKIE